MPVVTVCTHCQARFSAPEAVLNKRVKCSKCQQPFVVTAAPAKPAAPGAPQQPVAVNRSAPPAKAAGATASASTKQPSAKQPSANQAPAPVASTAKVAKPLSLAELNASFSGEMPRIRTPLAYQLGVLLSAVVMVALVVVYLLLIAAACYGVYYHYTHHTGMLGAGGSGRGRAVVFLAYLAPGVVGSIMIFFMLKPLLARPAKHNRSRSLTRTSEPLLFAFVERICNEVGAPMPKRIDVDCQVNASASFRRGFLSFLGRDLVLTIGLPLMAGLSLREFGGVLAHEFGHFSQGIGMRMTYLVRSISGWFMRVVYERDAWDEWLEESTNDLDLRIGWILLLAQFAVWLSRRVLWLLMHIGLLVSGLLLRQMEFDADRYQAGFVGAGTFADIFAKLRTLAVSSDLASAQTMEHLQERRLVDDYPALIVLNAKMMPPKAAEEIHQSAKAETTGWFDTHPSDSDRIAAAKRRGGEGIFRSERRASELLANFGAQAKATTWDWYMSVFGPKVPKEALVPAIEFAQASKSSWK